MHKAYAAVLVCLSLFCSLAFANDNHNFEAGKHYEVLPQPVSTSNKNKIEIVEVFWYGCRHCFNFEPAVQAWKKKLPEDAYFQQLPAVWNSSMKLHARAFFTAKSMKALDKVHQPLFNALNVQRKKLNDEGSIRALFVANGADGDKFDKTFNSFGVNSQLQIADSKTKGYRVQGTPELIVNGKYRVSSSLAGSQEKMFEVVEHLIEKERKALVNSKG